MDVGIAVKESRLKAKMSQKDAAAKLGINVSFLSLIENGRKKPSMEVIEKMCNVYSTPPAVMFWFMIEKKDVAPGKEIAFEQLKPLIDNLINQVF